MPGVLIDEPLQLGDILLVIGDWKRIRQLQAWTRDFILLNLPAEVDQIAPAASQAPHALLALEKTGVVDVVVHLLIRLSGGAGAHVMLLSMFILCAVTGLFLQYGHCGIDGAYRAGCGASMGVSPYPFAMIVAIAASAAFMTPVSGLLPGQYLGARVRGL